MYEDCFLRGVLNLFLSIANSTKNEPHATERNRALLLFLSRSTTVESVDVVLKNKKKWAVHKCIWRSGRGRNKVDHVDKRWSSNLRKMR